MPSKRLAKKASKKSPTRAIAVAGSPAARRGGRRTSSGIGYQFRYSAYIAARILGDQEPPQAWGLENVPLTAGMLEQDVALADLLVRTADDGYIVVQAKSRQQISDKAATKYPALIASFTRLYHEFRAELQLAGFPPRDFDASRDRLVLAIGKSTGPIRALHDLCERARDRVLSFAQLADTEATREITVVTYPIVRTILGDLGRPATDESLRAVFASLFVHVCPCGEGGTDEDSALTLLRSNVIPGTKATSIWNRIIAKLTDRTPKGLGFDFRWIVEQARAEGADVLTALADDKSDRSTLRSLSQRHATRYEGSTYISVGGRSISLRKDTNEALRARAATSSVLLIGEPGIGKTGAAVSLYSRCRIDTEDVVFIPVETLHLAPDGLPIHIQLGLKNDLATIFERWGGSGTAYLIIDGLDAARGNEELNGLLNTMRDIAKYASPRWHMVASMRAYDASRATRFGGRLTEVFPAANQNQASRFPKLEWLEVGELTDGDLRTIETEGPILSDALKDPDIRKLARNPFNLDLLVKVIEAGATDEQLLSVRTQLQLLRLYWQNRVEQPSAGRTTRLKLLEAACDAIVSAQALAFDEVALGDLTDRDRALEQLCSVAVLDEMSRPGAFSLRRFRFYHNVLFDFAFAKLRLLLPGYIQSVLSSQVGTFTLIAPSLRLYFIDLWDQDPDRSEYWSLLVELAPNLQIGPVTDLIAIEVASRRAVAPDDLKGLTLLLHDPDKRPGVLKVVEWLHGSLDVGDVDPFAQGGEPWGRLVVPLAQQGDVQSAFESFRLCRKLLEQRERLDPAIGQIVSEAARLLLTYFISSREQHRLIAATIEMVMETFTYAPTPSREALKAVIDSGSLADFAWNDAPALARGAKHIRDVDPDFVAEIYAAIFPCTETSDEPVSMTNSRIFGFSSNKRQDLEHAKWQLGEDFKGLLEVSIKAATFAMLSAVRASERLNRIAGKRIYLNVPFEGKKHRVRQDGSHLWLGSILTEHDPAFKIFDLWFERACELAENDPEAFDALLFHYLDEADLSIFYIKLLRKAAQHPVTVGRRIASLLLEETVLYSYDLSSDAAKFLQSVFPVLEETMRGNIEKAVLA